MQILYVDNHILVVNKPAGLATQPSKDLKESLECQAKLWIKKTFDKPGAVFLHAVHRIDKPVSGLVLFARTSKALSRLNACMREGKFMKKYTAVVEGCIGLDRATLEHYLIHGEHKAILSAKDDPNAKFCRLHFTAIERRESVSLLSIDLETGRYHQIRAQLAAIGSAIVGDTKYGAKTAPFTTHQIALHQGMMSFPHPITQQIQTFSCPPPWDLSQFL